jgi:hypothetical protein
MALYKALKNEVSFVVICFVALHARRSPALLRGRRHCTATATTTASRRTPRASRDAVSILPPPSTACLVVHSHPFSSNSSPSLTLLQRRRLAFASLQLKENTLSPILLACPPPTFSLLAASIWSGYKSPAGIAGTAIATAGLLLLLLLLLLRPQLGIAA